MIFTTIQKSIKDILIASLFSWIILYIGFFLFPPAYLLLASPYIVLGRKRSYESVLLALFLLGAGIFILQGWVLAVIITLLSLITVMPTLYLMKKEWKGGKIVLSVTALTTLLVLGIFALDAHGLKPVGQAYQTIIEETIQSQIQMMKDMSSTMDIGTNLDDFNQYIKEAGKVISVILPALLFVFFFLFNLINYYGAKYVLYKKNWDNKEEERFRDFALPDTLNTGLFFIIIGSLLLNLTGFDFSRELSLNLYSIFYVMLLCQGFAVGVYFLLKRKSILNYFVLVMTLLLNLRYIYVFIGLLDTIFYFRKNIGGNKWIKK